MCLKHCTDRTFLDGLYEHISNDSDTEQKQFNELKQFIKENEYDTEALIDDINNNDGSNLFPYLGTKLVEFIKHFIKYNKCMFRFVFSDDVIC